MIFIFFAFVLLSFASYHATLYYFPNLVYSRFYSKAVKGGQGSENKFAIIPAPNEKSRMVVKPNPDFAYASAFYDLKDGPIRLKGLMPDSTYWSLAFYQPNTINFYVKNDLQFADDNLDVILSTEHMDTRIEQILAPSKKGFILIRLLIEDRSENNVSKMINYLENLSISKDM